MKPEEHLKKLLDVQKREGQGLGYPIECLAPDAYHWTQVMSKRREYEGLFADGQSPSNLTLSNFFRNIYVDSKYITEPLSAEDVKAANAWKVAYLRRLRKEKTDESYINAYMQAWNLSSNDVFGPADKPASGLEIVK